ncbi:MAG: DUF4145 domain-containing protein [Commensalibacter sp.]
MKTSSSTNRLSKTFLEAEKTRLNKNFLAAAPIYRRTLEAAAINLDPELRKKDSFYERINKLVSFDILPKDMKDWITAIRLFGNDAAHDVDYFPTENEIEEASDCVRMVLIYLYELPTKISQMRRNRDERKGMIPTN